jgi:hypothetical protein
MEGKEALLHTIRGLFFVLLDMYLLLLQETMHGHASEGLGTGG